MAVKWVAGGLLPLVTGASVDAAAAHAQGPLQGLG